MCCKWEFWAREKIAGDLAVVGSDTSSASPEERNTLTSRDYSTFELYTSPSMRLRHHTASNVLCHRFDFRAGLVVLESHF